MNWVTACKNVSECCCPLFNNNCKLDTGHGSFIDFFYIIIEHIRWNAISDALVDCHDDGNYIIMTCDKKISNFSSSLSFSVQKVLQIFFFKWNYFRLKWDTQSIVRKRYEFCSLPHPTCSLLVNALALDFAGPLCTYSAQQPIYKNFSRQKKSRICPLWPGRLSKPVSDKYREGAGLHNAGERFELFLLMNY